MRSLYIIEQRELPPGLSERDARILRKIKFRAHHLDKGFRICGMRFGWYAFNSAIGGDGILSIRSHVWFCLCRTAIIGLIPVLGSYP